MDVGDVFDQLAFIAIKPRELVARIAADLDAKPLRMVITRKVIEDHIAQLVAKYGGRLGGMTRKNLISQVERKLKINDRRRWEKTQAWLDSLDSK